GVGGRKRPAPHCQPHTKNPPKPGRGKPEISALRSVSAFIGRPPSLYESCLRRALPPRAHQDVEGDKARTRQTTHQSVENQIRELRQVAERRGCQLAKV